MVLETPTSLYTATVAAVAFVTSSLTASAWIYDQQNTPLHRPRRNPCRPSNPSTTAPRWSKCQGIESFRMDMPFHHSRWNNWRNTRSTGTGVTLCDALQTETVETMEGMDAIVLPRTDRYNATISYQRLTLPDRAKLSSHAIFGALYHDNLIERYELYRHVFDPPSLDPPIESTEKDVAQTRDTVERDVITAVVKVGHGLDGHPGVVHGGILALLMDDVLGFGYAALTPVVTYAVTANLNINYTAPVPSGTTFLVTATALPQPEPHPRKLYWEVRVTSVDQSVTYCRASSLYIIPRGGTHSS